MDLMAWKAGIKELEEVVGRGKAYTPIQEKALERYVFRKLNPSGDEWAYTVASMASSWKWKNLPSPADLSERLKAAREQISDKCRGALVKVPCPRCLSDGYLWTRRDRWDEVDPGLDATGGEPLGRRVIRCGCDNSPPGEGATYADGIRTGELNSADWENRVGMRMNETEDARRARNRKALQRLAGDRAWIPAHLREEFGLDVPPGGRPPPPIGPVPAREPPVVDEVPF